MQPNSSNIILENLKFISGIIKEYKNKAILFFSVGFIIAISIFLFAEKQYTSDAIGLSYKIPSDYVVDIIDDLDDARKDNDDTTIAKLLKIDIKTAKKIKEITAASLDENKSVRDDGDLSQPNYFKIKITTTDKLMFDSLNNQIVNLINSNEFINQKIVSDKEYLLKNITYINKEIDTLSKVKVQIEKRIISGEANKNIMLLTDFSKIQTNLVDLKMRLEVYKNKLTRITGVSIVKRFTMPRKKSFPKIIPLFFIFEGIALFSLVIYIVISVNLKPNENNN